MINEHEISQIKNKAKLYQLQYCESMMNNSCTGIGVGKDINDKYCIVVYLLNENGKDKLPTSFEDTTVMIHVTGKIQAL
jgi:hypothetical protein